VSLNARKRLYVSPHVMLNLWAPPLGTVLVFARSAGAKPTAIGAFLQGDRYPQSLKSKISIQAKIEVDIPFVEAKIIKIRCS